MPYIPLSINSISKFQEGLRKIQEYQDGIDRKVDTALERLVSEGITVCYANSSVIDNRLGSGQVTIPNMIMFRQENVASFQGYTEVALVGRDVGKIISRWRYKGGIREAQVSPLLMAEFGSGEFADNSQFELSPISGVGQGTFPGQKHAFDGSWSWVDEEGQFHRSDGIIPSYPMLNGRNAMMVRVATIFREVFQ